MKKLLTLCILSLFVFSGCTNEEDNNKKDVQACDEDTTCPVGKSADMSAYEGFMETENQFIQIDMKDAIQKINTDSSGIFYIGYSDCPWCIEAVPVMNEVAKANNQKIYYIDKKAESSDEASINEMTSILSNILEKDEDGNPHLYVPEVFVVKDGEIVANNMGTVEGHDARERKMTSEEQAQLKATYETMFASLTFGAHADMSGYEGFDDAQHHFMKATMQDIIDKIENKESGIVYFGYATCPWCIEAVPIMNEVAKTNDQFIYYVDKKASSSDETTTAKVESLLSDVLTKDDDGKPHLYVPEVIIIQDGKVIANHLGTVEDHDAHERTLTTAEQAQLQTTYEDMFEKLK